MSNVKFLRGSQSKLNNLTSFKEGAFYLTNDTDRLYFAQSDSELVYLNKYITQVDTLANLQAMSDINDGDFYYVIKENILCTRITDGNGVHWAQINASQDTNTDTSIENISFSSKVEDNKIIITCTVQETNKNILTGLEIEGKQPAAISSSFEITSELLGSITVDTDVDVTATVENNIATIVTSGTGATTEEGAGFTISGAGGVTVKGQTDNIVISGAEYKLTSPANDTSITLPNTVINAVGDNIVSLVAGSENSSVTVTGANENEIVISHKTYNYDSSNELSNQDVSGINVTNPVINIVSGLETENGHVTGVKTSKVTLNADKINNLSLDDNGKLSISVANAAGQEKYTVDSEEVFYYTIGGNNVTIGQSLDNLYYTQSQIDSKFKAANALTLKGEIGESDPLPELAVESGDTYIITKSRTITLPDNTILNVKVGDLLIASGTETEGVLSDIDWIYVPSGDETVYTYTLSSTDSDGITLRRNDGVSNTIFIADDDIIVASSGDNKLSFSHVKTNPQTNEPTQTDLNNEGTFTVVTGVSANEYGHVTNVDKVTYKLPGNHQLSAEDNTITLKNNLAVSQGAVTIEGGNVLTTSTTEDAVNNKYIITIDHDTVAPTITEAEKNVVTIDLSADSSNAVFNTLQSINQDDYGHVNEIKNSKVSFVTINQFEHTKTQTNNDITITNRVNKSNGANVANNSTTLTSSSINFTLTEDAVNNGHIIKAEIEWGSFDD